MENPRRFLARLILFGAALFSSGGLSATTEPPELFMERPRIQSYGPEGLEWELVAPQGEGYTSSNLMRVEDLSVDLFEGGKKSSQITADEALMNTGSQGKPIALSSSAYGGIELQDGDMLLNGHVVVVSTEGSTLSTDWLHYHRRKELITSTAPVRIVRPDSVTTGVGLEATSDLSRVKIFKQRVVISDQAEVEKK